MSALSALSDGTALNSANFEYVRTEKAEASCTYIIGLGGGSPEGVAMEQLKTNAHLQPNQSLTNYCVTSEQKCIVGIVVIKTVTVTADVVQFR